MFGKIFAKKKPKDENRIAPETTKTKYHAIQVLPCEHSCDPARWVSSKIYLVSELSKLPLASCNKIDECGCKFKHYEDRRQNEDRRTDSIVLQNTFSGDETRKQKKKGRRDND